MITAVDTNILVDILEPDPIHGPGSMETLKRCLREGVIVACDVVWAEVAAVYHQQAEEVIGDLKRIGISFSPMSEEAALEAARCWQAFRKKGGGRDRIVADFLIGGHARIQCDRLLTRDRGFYRGYFKTLPIIHP